MAFLQILFHNNYCFYFQNIGYIVDSTDCVSGQTDLWLKWAEIFSVFMFWSNRLAFGSPCKKNISTWTLKMLLANWTVLWITPGMKNTIFCYVCVSWQYVSSNLKEALMFKVHFKIIITYTHVKIFREQHCKFFWCSE